MTEKLTEKQKEILLALYQGYSIVYGPYERKDGRYHVILWELGKKHNARKTISYPKALMEIFLNRRLNENETVDHRFGNILDNNVDNFNLLTRSENASKGALRVVPEEVKCVWCETRFIPSAEQRSQRSKSIAGPFCSRSCTGHYGAKIKNGGEELERNNIEVKYYSFNNGGVAELV